jgi:hypothetical protein
MSASNSVVLPVPGFPAGVDVHWETQRRIVWNEREHTSEERELGYETSWVAELDLWRGFLTSQRKVKAKDLILCEARESPNVAVGTVGESRARRQSSTLRDGWFAAR